jgi:hypothetical protein
MVTNAHILETGATFQDQVNRSKVVVWGQTCSRNIPTINSVQFWLKADAKPNKPAAPILSWFQSLQPAILSWKPYVMSSMPGGLVEHTWIKRRFALCFSVFEATNSRNPGTNLYNGLY